MLPSHPHRSNRLSRRQLLRFGAAGLSASSLLQIRSSAAATKTEQAAPTTGTTNAFGRAKSCIVLFAWGGMSHIDTLDVKPDASSDIRSIFHPIATRTPGYYVSEHLPNIAKQTHRMAIVRSVHHNAPSHRSGAYWNLTGHEPPNLSGNWEASRDDWPCIGSMVWDAKLNQHGSDLQQRLSADGLSGAVCLPYSMYDGGRANGQDGGFLGMHRDPMIIKPREGKPYDGVSPSSGHIDLELVEGLDRDRLSARRKLLSQIDASRDVRTNEGMQGMARHQTQALDMLLSERVQRTFDLNSEPAAVRERYGMHVCGQSVLTARKLTEAGVPLVTVYCSAGDLNGSVGAHWDTHGDGFNRLKNQMIPPWDQASAALLDDLSASGRLDETLVVWLTEFGRTPRVNPGGGRDHYPNVYSVAFAGAGIAGGLVYGKSDRNGAEPLDQPCGPADLHATIFHSLGISDHFTLYDTLGRPLTACNGRPLPLFA
ncbi:DUF1501 domain-containing protein [Rosistilla oblonga]|uniref:DUF1501 domain-containing protein n=1 Tax=Rosistilla oblonga TaxID=2527990 RepID=UPI003A97FF34